mmetsp:Transcript_50530/g.110561  ORF Transcript_50530/g.110561 Transcript_50530/m.110561 type:complete len:607 (+) Transcript_50530:278-2098(+)
MNATVSSVADDVDEFLRQMMAPEKACHSKLLRYRTLLNHLHKETNLVYSSERALVETITSEEAVIGDLQARIQLLVSEGDKKLKTCQRQRQESCDQHQMYSLELKELKQIGKAPRAPLALFQTVMTRARRPGSQFGRRDHVASASLHARRMVSHHRNLQACISSSQVPDPVLQQQDLRASNGRKEDKCHRERAKLEESWKNAFMVMQKLAESSGDACVDDSCEEAVHAQLNYDLPVIHQERADHIKNVRQAQHDLVEVRHRMELLDGSLEKAEAATKEAQEECGTVAQGSKYLEQVRSLIQNMKQCPGLAGPAFTIPRFHSVVDLSSFDVLGSSEKELDAELNAACKSAAPEDEQDAVRAATHTELRGRLIDNLPKLNTGSLPIFGSCPGCRGEKYGAANSGRLRRCFQPGSKLCCKGEVLQCKEKRVTAVCVLERSVVQRDSTPVDLTFFFGTVMPKGKQGILDAGTGFGEKEQSLIFGWNCDGDPDVDYASGRRGLDRGGGLGLNHFDRSNTCRGNNKEYKPINWELELPNGKYNVMVNFGHEDVDSTQRWHTGCQVEGIGVCDSSDPCLYEGPVNVKDGRLTITGYGHDSRECHSLTSVTVRS